MDKNFGKLNTKETLRQASIEHFAEQELNPKYTNDDIELIKNVRFSFNHYFDFGNITEGLVDKNRKAEEQTRIFHQSAELAKIKDINNIPEDVSEQSRELILKYKDDYLRFLKEQEAAALRFKSECIKRYEEEFSQIVKNISSQIQNGVNPKNIEGYLDPGTFSHVFKVQTESGVYVVKMYLDNVMSFRDLEAMRVAKDAEHVSKLVAYSQKDKTLVMKFLPGKNFTQLSKEEKPQLTDEEIKSIFQIIIDLQKKGIEPDPDSKNFLYDEKEGFSVIDYHIIDESKNFMDTLRILPKTLSVREGIVYDQSYDAEVNSLNRRMVSVLEQNFPNFCNEHKTDFENWKSSI
jgi:hypothetical protein